MFDQSLRLLHSTPRGLLYIQVLIDATSYQLVKTQLSILDDILLTLERHQQQRLKNHTYPNGKTGEVIMNEQLNERFHVIIHSHAAAAGNLIPVPGLGIAADITAMTSMCTFSIFLFLSYIVQLGVMIKFKNEILGNAWWRKTWAAAFLD